MLAELDMRNSEMEFELDPAVWEEAEQENKGKDRNRVHVGSAEFAHLENFDMNELCAVVTVCGRK